MRRDDRVDHARGAVLFVTCGLLDDADEVVVQEAVEELVLADVLRLDDDAARGVFAEEVIPKSELPVRESLRTDLTPRDRAPPLHRWRGGFPRRQVANPLKTGWEPLSIDGEGRRGRAG